MPNRLPLSRLARTLALILALACQVAAGGLLPADAAPSEALTAATVLCRSGQHPLRHAPAPRHRRTEAALIRAVSAGGVLHALEGGGAPATPAPSVMRIGMAWRPAARAPPAVRCAASYPRGPPAQV